MYPAFVGNFGDRGHCIHIRHRQIETDNLSLFRVEARSNYRNKGLKVPNVLGSGVSCWRILVAVMEMGLCMALELVQANGR